MSKEIYQLFLAAALRLLKTNLLNEDHQVFLIWAKLFKKDMSKLVPKDMSLIDTPGFHDLFKLHNITSVEKVQNLINIESNWQCADF